VSPLHNLNVGDRLAKVPARRRGALILPSTSFSPSLDFLLARGRPSRGCEESDVQKPAYDPFHEMFPIYRIFAIA
jgi:hypothetical protein